MLLVDAGGLVGDDHGDWSAEKDNLDEGGDRDGPLRATTIVDAMSLMGYDVVNLSDRELRLGLPLISDLSLISTTPFVTANVTSGTSNQNNNTAPAPAPWQQTVFRQYGDLTVAVIGLLSPELWSAGGGPTAHDPLQVLTGLMPGVRARGDLVVVLAHMDLASATRIARQVNGIDVVVAAGTGELQPEPIITNGTLLVSAGRNGRRVGRVDLTVDASGRVIRHDGTSISLVEEVGEDESVRELVDASM